MVTFPLSFSALDVRGSKIGITWSSRSRSGEHSADDESAQVFNQEFHFDGSNEKPSRTLAAGKRMARCHFKKRQPRIVGIYPAFTGEFASREASRFPE
jgi:hypothetical protein